MEPGNFDFLKRSISIGRNVLGKATQDGDAEMRESSPKGDFFTNTSVTKNDDDAMQVDDGWGIPGDDASGYSAFADQLENLLHIRGNIDESIDMLSILPQYQTFCATRSKRLQQREASDADYQIFGSAQEFKMWLAESQTWQLLMSIYQSKEHVSIREERSRGQDVNQWSDRALVEELEFDPTFRKLVAVKTWLEVTAGHYVNNVQKKRYTREAGVQDPDRVSREGHPAPLQHEECEKQLAHTIFECLRRGRLSQAKAACHDANEPWRAESINGGALYTESPQFDPLTATGSKPPMGNRTRNLWKASCYALATDPSTEAYERAVYGSLCGDIDTVLPVCATWEDHAWAKFNALIEYHIQKHLEQFKRQLPVPGLPFPAPRVMDPRGIFASLANSEIPVIRESSKDLFKEIQVSIIIGQTQTLISRLAERCRGSIEGANCLSSQKLRFMAHLVLFLRSKDEVLPEADGNYFIHAYVDHLIGRKLYQFVPLYASFLPAALQIKACASYLSKISGPMATRRELVQAIRKHSLHLHAILRATADLALQEAQSSKVMAVDPAHNLKKSIIESPSDQEKAEFRALEWLTFVGGPSFNDLLLSSNALMRKYLLQGRLYTAYALSKTLPQEMVLAEQLVLQHYRQPTAVEAQSYEMLFYRSLFGARLAYEEWERALTNEPISIASSATKQSWKEGVKELADKAKESIVELLETSVLFKARWSPASANGGEARPSSSEGEAEQGKDTDYARRNKELDQLRKLYIPELVFSLHLVLHDSARLYPEYLEQATDELVQLVAAPRNEGPEATICEAMKQAGRLREFLDLVRQSSLERIKEQPKP
ncbi:Nucleoporin nup84 [Actinomortierella ambigua]|nr:Nucleoporin nup84 [Actinomortierella ambigua]